MQVEIPRRRPGTTASTSNAGARRHTRFLAAGADGNLWFTTDGTKIGHITVAGVITEFSLPTSGGVSFSIAGGPDGNLWVTRYDANIINRVTPSGTVTTFSLDSRFTGPSAITAGLDGNLWFTHGQAIGRITP